MSKPSHHDTPTPALRRAPMVPLAWAGHPLRRAFAAMVGRNKGTPPWHNPTDVRPLKWRRLLLLALVAIGSYGGTATMVDVLPNKGTTPLEMGIAVLFCVLFAWVSAGFWTAMMGVYVLLRGRDADAITAEMPPLDSLIDRQAAIDPSARTAVIMPICNEHVATVFAGLRATYESVEKSGLLDRFDFFVLSDTNKPDIRADEQSAWSELRRVLGAEGRLFYRWRQVRTKKKAGNVSDFCRRFGADYRYLVVLDADSVMTGDCLANLVRLMEAHPDAGIIQTAPRACGHDTMHARSQQFGSRVYGPIFTAGMHYWQLGESHYWGHNAILRLKPFMDHCGLAPLPGTGSLSGEVMSHDFVEAALMRRAGFKVWIAYDMEGSFEQFPPNLVSEVMRDRRWCQGNLQNARLIFEPGMHPVHRSVFLTGILAYVSAPLWLGFLLLSTLLFASQSVEVPQYFSEPYQLFPIWPHSNIKLMMTLFALTASLLILPKMLALVVIMVRGKVSQYGGVGRLWASALFEFLHSMLLAPVRMLFHTQFVLGALTGWKGGWQSPPREDDATPWMVAWKAHGAHSLFAVAWIGGILASGSKFPWWFTPVVGGLLFAVPVSVWTSRADFGRFFRRLGLWTIPEEQALPAELMAARHYADTAPETVDFIDVVVRGDANAQAAAAAPVRGEATGMKGEVLRRIVDRALREGPKALKPAEGLRLLADRHGLQTLHRQVHEDSRAHPDWFEPRRDGEPAPVQVLRPAPAATLMAAANDAKARAVVNAP